MVTAPDGSTIQRKIIYFPSVFSDADYSGVDTTYTEIPGHKFWVTPKPRIANSRRVSYFNKPEHSYYNKSEDADIMKRRFEEAMSVSKDKRQNK